MVSIEKKQVNPWEEDESTEEDDYREQRDAQQDETNKFDVLCEGVLNSMALLHQSLQGFLEVKDVLLQHFLPPPVMVKIALTSSKVYRSVTDIQEPIHELIRMVRIFSTPWEEKSAALRKLHEDFHKKRRQLDVAIRRLNLIDAEAKKIAQERRILNWEKLYCKVTNAKSHGRRWKYTIGEIKRKAAKGYDVLVQHYDAIEMKSSEAPLEAEPAVEASDVNMNAITEEEEEGSEEEQESGGERFSDGSDMEESLGPETLKSAYSAQAPKIAAVPPKPEMAEKTVSTYAADYDLYLHVRCFCPKGIEGREVKCSVTLGTQFEKTSRLDHTDEELAEMAAAAAPPKPKGPLRRGAPPPQPKEEEKPAIVKFSELRFPLRPKRIGRREFPAALQPLTVTVHTGPEETIVAMARIEVEDIEGCEMPEVFAISDSRGADLSLADAILYSADAKKDSQLQLTEPLPVSFPVYPLSGGKANSQPTACGAVPLFFFYTKIYKPKHLSQAVGTGSVRDIIMEELGIDIAQTSRETLFPDRQDLAISPMTVDTPVPSQTEEMVTLEEYETVVALHQKELNDTHQHYNMKFLAMQEKITQLEAELKTKPSVIYQTESPSSKPHPAAFVFKKEKREPKKLRMNRKLPQWGKDLPEDFFERMEMYQDEYDANKRAITEHLRKEESDNIEKKLAFQNKAFRGSSNDAVDALKDVTLPALFMPQPGANVYNPRAHQYFHATGSGGLRLTQPPSIMDLPPLKHMSVLNLFELGQNIHNPNLLLQRYVTFREGRELTMQSSKGQVNTADPEQRDRPQTRSAGEKPVEMTSH